MAQEPQNFDEDLGEDGYYDDDGTFVPPVAVPEPQNFDDTDEDLDVNGDLPKAQLVGVDDTDDDVEGDDATDEENEDLNELDDDGNLLEETLADGSPGNDAGIGTASPAAAEVTPVPEDTDWRVRLHLPDGSQHLYQDPDVKSGSILAPLLATRGVIFPYTPTINVQYNANYENYDLTHSNYRGYFYTGSAVQNIIVSATFTAQDTNEANYMLAAMHFLRSATKMFYGKDQIRGTPPPVLMLSGFGEFQFKNHPCAITAFQYNLPNDVDYIAAGAPPTSTNPAARSNLPGSVINQAANATGNIASLSGLLSKSARLFGAGIIPGAERAMRSSLNGPSTQIQSPILDSISKIHDGVTYVPTKIDLNFTMIPIQTRKQVSNEFSLKDYASGKLLKKGFW